MSNRKFWVITCLVAVVPGGLAVAAGLALYRHINRKRQLRRVEEWMRENGIQIEEHSKWARA